MSDVLWIARDGNGEVWTYESEPEWDVDQFRGRNGRFLGYSELWKNYIPDPGTKRQLVTPEMLGAAASAVVSNAVLSAAVPTTHVGPRI